MPRIEQSGYVERPSRLDAAKGEHVRRRIIEGMRTDVHRPEPGEESTTPQLCPKKNHFGIQQRHIPTLVRRNPETTTPTVVRSTAQPLDASDGQREGAQSRDGSVVERLAFRSFSKLDVVAVPQSDVSRVAIRIGDRSEKVVDLIDGSVMMTRYRWGCTSPPSSFLDSPKHFIIQGTSIVGIADVVQMAQDVISRGGGQHGYTPQSQSVCLDKKS